MAKRERYVFINHTADVEYVAYGSTIDRVFKNALLGLFDTIADIKKLSAAKAKVKLLNIEERARIPEDLLWFVLQDALSVTDAEGVYAYSVKKIKIGLEMGEYSAVVTIAAKKKDPKFSKLDVKGVSRFDMKVTKKDKTYLATVVLDV